MAAQHEPLRAANFPAMDFPLELTTKRGLDVIFRAAREEDAQRLLTHLDVIGPELNLKPGDLTITLEQEKRLLRQYEESENSLFLIAEHQGQIVGSLTLYGGRRWSNAHVGQLGVSVRPELRSSGIGSLLLETAIAWSKEGGVVKRLEILSYETNERARQLYLKLGFEIEGLKRAAVMREGDYIDVYQMAMLLGDAKEHALRTPSTDTGATQTTGGAR
jgi:RimJ/RimL family protein N-acetyltransferase